MVDIVSGMSEAGRLILEGDPTLYGIVFRSLLFSGVAVILAALWGTPIAMLISLKIFKGKTIVKGFFNSLIGIPTVVLGLVLFLLFSKSGPLGFLGLLYSPSGIIIGEAILVTPILISIMITCHRSSRSRNNEPSKNSRCFRIASSNSCFERSSKWCFTCQTLRVSTEQSPS